MKNFISFKKRIFLTYVIDGLQEDKIKKFLNYFSITIKEYKLKLKSLGIDNIAVA